jgi:predicted phosphoadenosine phosphosulfate sulfurtransferase
MLNGKRWTTGLGEDLFNIYPIYDWTTQDIWRFHAKFPELPSNPVYDLMFKAGVPLSKQRLCQPYGDDQRQGLWLYHILEPETWFKLIARVNGANSGALYVQETGNIAGYGAVTLPDGHNWKSFTNLLLASLPKQTREHYIKRFRSFIKGWQSRGYEEIPDEAPAILEAKQWAPSWRRMAKCLLRNDHWCKSLGQAQPKSEAYQAYKDIKAARKARLEAEKAERSAIKSMQDALSFDEVAV